MTPDAAQIAYHPLTPERWADFEAFFSERRILDGCWCMWWRIKRREFQAQQNEGKRQAMKAIVDDDRVPGLLAYVDGELAGWVSVAPREDFGVLQRSRTLKPIDDQPVWSIVCFYVDKEHRGQGLMRGLIEAAVDYAAQHGARIVEAYPIDPTQTDVTRLDVFTGFIDAFRDAGFVEALRRSQRQPIMRREIAAS
jgi:GNAT superfamily N-acetyltransferase